MAARLEPGLLAMGGNKNWREFTTELSSQYLENYEPSDWLDLRSKVLPQTINQVFPEPVRYTQVFEDRLGFVPNCSVLDLIFCEGKNAGQLLLKK